MSELLQEPMVEAHGQVSHNGRRLKCAEIDNVFPMARGLIRADIQRRLLQFAEIKHLHSALFLNV